MIELIADVSAAVTVGLATSVAPAVTATATEANRNRRNLGRVYVFCILSRGLRRAPVTDGSLELSPGNGCGTSFPLDASG